MRVFITLLAVVCLMMSQATAQKYRLPLKEIQKVASESLATFSKLVKKQKNYREMGFTSPDEVRIATLGEPMRVFMVRLDQLRNYQPGSDPNRLLSGGDHVIYPVEVEGHVRSSVIIGKTKGQWKAVSFGSPNLVKMLSTVRKENSDAAGLPTFSYFVVHVPALNLYFIAHRINEVLLFTPLLDDPRYKFKAGATMLADRTFEAILPAAKAHDGLPR